MFDGKTIPGYRHQPGFHCASSAIRNVLAFHGIRLSEPAVIGLGRGPGFSYHVIDHRPSRLVHMRNLDLEANFFRTVGLDFRWRETEDAAEATAQVKASVDRGLPVLIQTDIIHLPYFNTDQHFPGHAVVICGYSDEKEEFYVSDTLHPEALAVAIPDMERARTSVFPPFALRNRSFVLDDLSGFHVDEAVVRGAVRRWAEENLDGIPEMPEPYGVRSLSALIEDLPNWKDAADWQWSARFTYQIIERRGTGGAGFRTLYRQFLEEGEEQYPALRDLRLSRDLAVIEGLYHDMAAVFRRISDGEAPDFSPARPVLEDLLTRETAFYRRILRSV
ncbi:MAG: BtrH N-terminal domain-containing protein [Syntrophales bacterium]